MLVDKCENFSLKSSFEKMMMGFSDIQRDNRDKRVMKSEAISFLYQSWRWWVVVVGVLTLMGGAAAGVFFSWIFRPLLVGIPFQIGNIMNWCSPGPNHLLSATCNVHKHGKQLQ